jgi:hypothetical protein
MSRWAVNKETAEAWVLGGYGLAVGVFKEYVKPELTAKRAWLGIIAGVTAYELTCKDGELLSEGVDRAIEKHPVAVPLAIGVTALHLCNLLPPKLDPYHQITELIKR